MSGDDIPADEPRAVDIVTGNVDEDDLDPETIAQLARWFGAATPNAAMGSAPAPVDPDILEAQAAKKRAADSADPALVARLEQWTTSGDPLIKLPPPMENVGPDTSLPKFDMSVWGLRTAGRAREVEPPDKIREALKERTPQALLRDLHRPETHFGDVYMDMVDTGLDVGGVRARRLVKDAITTTYTIKICDELAPRQWMDADFADLRTRLNQPWSELAVREEPAAK